ncbi:hypothetical protein G2W53_022807 [Senna tora]|uniref:Uncharacterized protein n=1 Tax=Senna tora TaxID=362788 RepID=A0A834TLV5_9FABA|nr:hypothetical protein G2W53_022807 [Senna tora]
MNEGIDPRNLFWNRLIRVRFLNSEKLEGISPVSSLMDTSKDLRLIMVESSGGISPVRLFICRNRVCRFFKLLKLVGISPDKLHQNLQALELGVALGDLAGEVVPGERELPEFPQLHDLLRQRSGEVVVVHIEYLELRHVERDLAGEVAGEGVVGDVEDSERREFPDLLRKFAGEVVGGDGERGELVQEANLRRNRAEQRNAGDVERDHSEVGVTDDAREFAVRRRGIPVIHCRSRGFGSLHGSFELEENIEVTV